MEGAFLFYLIEIRLSNIQKMVKEALLTVFGRGRITSVSLATLCGNRIGPRKCYKWSTQLRFRMIMSMYLLFQNVVTLFRLLSKYRDESIFVTNQI